MSKYEAAYRRHMNLKLAAEELGVPWPTLYSKLKAEGVEIVGDKLRYGSDRDRLAAMAEAEFLRLVPKAHPMNAIRWQSKHDFEVGALKVDVKASLPRQLSKKYEALAWSFSFKKQTLLCDFICCFCMDENKKIEKILLVPSEFFAGLQTVSVSCNGSSKWLDYQVQPEELSKFFASIKQPKGKSQ